ncbi:unnamed protein product, partial [Mesorhabditis belari]|uniref:Uncharacterized protein n=1 Tax=Mesorhabditis belari TaxID=2138241 RepID=A0AAF3E8Q6_9BILA
MKTAVFGGRDCDEGIHTLQVAGPPSLTFTPPSSLSAGQQAPHRRSATNPRPHSRRASRMHNYVLCCFRGIALKNSERRSRRSPFSCRTDIFG